MTQENNARKAMLCQSDRIVRRPNKYQVFPHEKLFNHNPHVAPGPMSTSPFILLFPNVNPLTSFPTSMSLFLVEAI